MSSIRNRPASAFPTSYRSKDNVNTSHFSQKRNVDETLFGRKSRPRSAVPVQSDQQQTRQSFQTGDFSIQGNSVPVAITYAEYQRIKQRSILGSNKSDDNDENVQLSTETLKMTESEARKQRIIESEKERLSRQRPSSATIDRQNKDKEIIERANLAKIEDEDFVKTLNEKMNAVKAIHLRKSQMEEVQQRRDTEKKIEEQYKIEMELRDLKEFERLNLIEKLKQEKEIRDAEIIAKQRAEVKLRQKQIEDEERKQDQALISRMLKEEQESRLREKAKKKEQHDLLVSGLKYTEVQIQNKKIRKQEELEYDRKLVAFQMAREKEQNDQELRRKQLQKDKALEVDKLRQKQQKDIDYKARLDMLRAKRATEAFERAAIKRDLDEAKRKSEQKREMNDYLKYQMKQKEKEQGKRMEEIKQLYAIEVVSRQKQIEKEQEDERNRIENEKRYRESILQEIKEKELKKREYIDEQIRTTRQIEEQNMDYIDSMNRIKQKKIQELRDLGIEEQSLIELERMDPRKFLNK